MKILDVAWQSAGATIEGTIGIVRVDTDYDGIKYFVGVGIGRDADVDAQYIADWGGTFPSAAGDVLFNIK